MKNITFSNLSFSCAMNKQPVSAKGIRRDVGINPTESHTTPTNDNHLCS